MKPFLLVHLLLVCFPFTNWINLRLGSSGPFEAIFEAFECPWVCGHGWFTTDSYYGPRSMWFIISGYGLTVYLLWAVSSRFDPQPNNSKHYPSASQAGPCTFEYVSLQRVHKASFPSSSKFPSLAFAWRYCYESGSHEHSTSRSYRAVISVSMCF